MKEVLIIGAGTMGSGIAIVFAVHDYQVTLIDQTEEIARKAKDRIDSAVTDMMEASYFSESCLKRELFPEKGFMIIQKSYLPNTLNNGLT